MSEEITQKELDELRAKASERDILVAKMDNSVSITDPTSDPTKEEELFCSDCNANGTHTIVQRGQHQCNTCKAQLEW